MKMVIQMEKLHPNYGWVKQELIKEDITLEEYNKRLESLRELYRNGMLRTYSIVLEKDGAVIKRWSRVFMNSAPLNNMI